MYVISRRLNTHRLKAIAAEYVLSKSYFFNEEDYVKILRVKDTHLHMF